MAESQRPSMLVGVVGTGTEVGKTWVACSLLTELRQRNRTVAARKPAQSFEIDDVTTDADELARATGEDSVLICPAHRRYEIAMAPPMAADALGRNRVVIAELVDEIRGSWGGRSVDVGLVETAGGVRSPMAHDGDCVDLLRTLDIDVVMLVADAGLGTINSIRLAVDALATLGRPVTIFLNRFDEGTELHRRNRDWCANDAALSTATITPARIITTTTQLADDILSRARTFCTGCGHTDCAGGCTSELEAPHHCPICGRAVAVTIVPTGWTTRCRVHGSVGQSA